MFSKNSISYWRILYYNTFSHLPSSFVFKAPKYTATLHGWLVQEAAAHVALFWLP